jgi:hypothetical protein
MGRAHLACVVGLWRVFLQLADSHGSDKRTEQSRAISLHVSSQLSYAAIAVSYIVHYLPHARQPQIAASLDATLNMIANTVGSSTCFQNSEAVLSNL